MIRDISHMLPTDGTLLDRDWVIEALGSDSLSGSTISNVSVRQVGQERGHLGASFMVDITYDVAREGNPSSIVVKTPSAHDGSRQTARRGNLYEREHRFFTELSQRTRVRAPHCFAAGISEDASGFVLVLEDVSGRDELDQIAGCSIDFAASVLRELARMHADWWDDSTLADLSWLTRFSNPDRIANLTGLASRGWPMLLESMDPGQRERVRDAGARCLDNIGSRMAMLDDLPQTLLHGDPRLDNLMADAGSSRDPVALLDWQNVSRGPGVCDVAYFLVQSLSVDDLTEHLQTLSQVYLDELTAGGVAAPSIDAFLQSFLMAMPMSFAVASSLAELGDLESERTRKLAHSMAERAAATVRQIEALAPTAEVISQ